MLPLDAKLMLWAGDVQERILKNFEVQRIYPFKPYPDSPEATKSLYDSFYWAVWAQAGGDEAKVQFFFNYYAFFVDAGVGRGMPYKHDNDAASNYEKRYKDWARRGCRVSRPFLMSEIRFQTRRLTTIMQNRYNIMGMANVIFGLTNSVDTDGAIRFSFPEARINEKNLSVDAIAVNLWGTIKRVPTS